MNRGEINAEKPRLTSNVLLILVLSYNQPTFCPDASWSLNASTLATGNTGGSTPYGIFIDGINTIYVTSPNKSSIFVWSPENLFVARRYTLSNVSRPYSIFTTINGDAYVDDGYSNGRVNRWPVQFNNSQIVMHINGSCYDLFVDINNNLHCSLGNSHQVIKYSLSHNASSPIVSAGNGSAGSTAELLDLPLGIYVDWNLNLYVADCGNDRIQFFRAGNSRGTTITTNGETGLIILSCPTDVVLDAEQNLFIVDGNNHRIIGSGANRFRCIAGCLGPNASLPSSLFNPRSMAFDSYGNIFVTDTGNSRIQKFTLLNNTCGISFTANKR